MKEKSGGGKAFDDLLELSFGGLQLHMFRFLGESFTIIYLQVDDESIADVVWHDSANRTTSFLSCAFL